MLAPAPRSKAVSSRRRVDAALGLACALAAPGVWAQAPAPSVPSAPAVKPPLPASDAVAALIGTWRGKTVDTVSWLYVRPDGSFCFMLMGGALDWIAAGRWEASSTYGGEPALRLREARPAREPYMLRLVRDPQRPAGARSLWWNAQSFGGRGALLGFTLEDLRLMPPAGAGSDRIGQWMAVPQGATSVFIGLPEDPAGAGPLKVTEYDLSDRRFNVVQINPDDAAIIPPLDGVAMREGTALLLKPTQTPVPASQWMRLEKQPDPPAGQQAKLHARCIAPVLGLPPDPAQTRPPVGDHEFLRLEAVRRLTVALPPPRPPWTTESGR